MILNHKQTLRLSALVTCITLCSVGCKEQKDKSDVQGVEAVTSGEKNTTIGMQCGATNMENEGTAAEKARNRVYAALPLSMRSYFQSAEASVKIVKDVVAECKKAISDMPEDQKEQAEKRLAASKMCWQPVEVEASKQKVFIPQVLIADDAQIINDKLLSLYAYLFLTYFIDHGLQNAVTQTPTTLTGNESTVTTDQLASALESLKKTRSDLVAAVLADLKGVKGKKDETVIEYLQKEFGTKSLSASAEFQNFVVSEFAESYYCSPATADRLKSQPFEDSSKAWSKETLAHLQGMFEILGAPAYLSANKAANK